MIEALTLAISYPLRLMATFAAAGLLKALGIAVVTDRTLLTLGADGKGLAVTDACSGIEQLFALIIIGTILAAMMQKSLAFRFLHGACILPSLVLANTLRLVVTVLLYTRFGEVILGSTWHHALGYAQCVLTLLILWLFGKAFALINNTSAPNSPSRKNMV